MTLGSALGASYHPAMRTLTILALLLLPACRDKDTGDPSDTAPSDTAVTIGEVVVGEPCPRMELVGAVELSIFDGNVSLGGVIYDAPQPFTGVPTLNNEHCSFHQYDASACGGCGDPLVCAGDGDCVPMPSAFTDLRVTARDGNVWQFVEADPKGGWLYEQWPHSGDDWAMDVSFGQDAFSVPAMAIADGDIGVRVSADGDYHGPGALTVSWTPVLDGSLVRTEVPINHHAQAGTFTHCEAGAEVGGFTADAAMINPLAVITGLEFQGVEHLNVASVATSVGCVELRYGTHIHTDVELGG